MSKEDKDLNENGIVTGDHGYDPINIASGQSSGNIVDAGPSPKKKKGKKTKIKRKKIQEVVIKFRKD